MCDEYFLQCLNVFSEKGYILYFIEYYVQTLTSILMQVNYSDITMNYVHINNCIARFWNTLHMGVDPREAKETCALSSTFWRKKLEASVI